MGGWQSGVVGGGSIDEFWVRHKMKEPQMKVQNIFNKKCIYFRVNQKIISYWPTISIAPKTPNCKKYFLKINFCWTKHNLSYIMNSVILQIEWIWLDWIVWSVCCVGVYYVPYWVFTWWIWGLKVIGRSSN